MASAEMAPKLPRKDEYGLGSNLLDIVISRNHSAPNLDYLQYGDKTTYGQSFAYSSEMLDALSDPKQGPQSRPSAKRGKEGLGEAPWAEIPGELQPPAVSLYGADFKGKPQEDLSGQVPVLTKRTREMRSRIDAKREELRSRFEIGSYQRSFPRSVTPTSLVEGTTKRFDHTGVTRRPLSETLERQIAAARVAKPPTKPPQAIPDICNPLMGGESIFAWNADLLPQQASEHDDDTAMSVRYAKDRQMHKHRRLEAARFTAGATALHVQGWDTSCDFNGREKKIGHPEFSTTLSSAEVERVERQLEEYRQELLRKKEERAREREQETQHTEEVEKRHKHGRGTPSTQPPASTLPPETPGSRKMKPIGEDCYRPELPAARLPAVEVEKLLRLSLPPDAHQMAAVAQLTAPPWGRPSDEDDRYEKIRVYNSRAKKTRVETVGKLEVDRELKIVRDGGLQRREKKSLLKTLDPEQVKYLKSLGNQAMKPMKHPA